MTNYYKEHLVVLHDNTDEDGSKDVIVNVFAPSEALIDHSLERAKELIQMNLEGKELEDEYASCNSDIDFYLACLNEDWIVHTVDTPIVYRQY